MNKFLIFCFQLFDFIYVPLFFINIFINDRLLFRKFAWNDTDISTCISATTVRDVAWGVSSCTCPWIASNVSRIHVEIGCLRTVMDNTTCWIFGSWGSHLNRAIATSFGINIIVSHCYRALLKFTGVLLVMSRTIWRMWTIAALSLLASINTHR